MSRAHKAWAAKVDGPKGMDRAILKEIAERVKDDGIWQFCLKDLASAVGVSRNSLRRTLDRLAAMSLIAFKPERYRGGDAQAGHRFMLIRNEDDAKSAKAGGFSSTRQALERAEAAVVGGSSMDRGVGPDCTEGGPALGRRVGPLLDPRKHNPNPLSKHIPPSDKSEGGCAPARSAAPLQGELIADDTDGKLSRERRRAQGDGEVAVLPRPPTAKPKRTKRAETPWSDDLVFGDAERTCAEAHGFRGNAGTRLWTAFEAYAKSTDRRYVDWFQAWRNWVVKQVSFDTRRGGQRTATGGTRSRPPRI